MYPLVFSIVYVEDLVASTRPHSPVYCLSSSSSFFNRGKLRGYKDYKGEVWQTEDYKSR